MRQHSRLPDVTIGRIRKAGRNVFCSCGESWGYSIRAFGSIGRTGRYGSPEANDQP